MDDSFNMHDESEIMDLDTEIKHNDSLSFNLMMQEFPFEMSDIFS